MESAIQGNFAIRNGVTSAQKMKLIGAEPSPSRISEFIPKIMESGILSGFEGELKVHKLDYHIPHSFSEASDICGRICGNKAYIVFFEKEGRHFAVNMSKKTGTLFDYSLTDS